MRLELSPNLGIASDASNRNARLTNLLQVKSASGRKFSEVRPGLDFVIATPTSTSGNGMTEFNGKLLCIFDAGLKTLDVSNMPVVTFPTLTDIAEEAYFTVSDICTGATEEGYSDIMVSGYGDPLVLGTYRYYIWQDTTGFVVIPNLSSVNEDTGLMFSSSGTVFGIANFVGATAFFRMPKGEAVVYLEEITSSPSINRITSVNLAGTACTAIIDTAGISEAVLWTNAEGVTHLTNPGGAARASAEAVSEDGIYVTGGYRTVSTNVERCYRWTTGSGMVSLGNLGADITNTSSNMKARGAYISEDGGIICGYSYTAGLAQRAFYWTAAGGMVDLDSTATYTQIILHGMSAEGSVVCGEYRVGSTWYAFEWNSTDAIITEITFGTHIDSYCHGVSTDGTVLSGLVTYTGGVIKVYVRTDGVTVLYDAPAAYDSDFQQARQRFMSKDGTAFAYTLVDSYVLYSPMILGGHKVLPRFRSLADLQDEPMDFVQSTL